MRPLTTHEQRMAAEQRRWWVARYVESCRLLGSLPPSPTEVARMLVSGPPSWWTPPNRPDDSVQLTSLGRGQYRAVS